MKNETVKNNEVKSSNLDSSNLSAAKINLKKGKISEIMEKEGKEGTAYANKHLYIGLEKMGIDDQKKHRGMIRRNLRRYVSIILGKDKSELEKVNAILEFIPFYKKNWKITDFKIENFSSSKNESDLKDYKNLLFVVRESME